MFEWQSIYFFNEVSVLRPIYFLQVAHMYKTYTPWLRNILWLEGYQIIRSIVEILFIRSPHSEVLGNTDISKIKIKIRRCERNESYPINYIESFLSSHLKYLKKVLSVSAAANRMNYKAIHTQFIITGLSFRCRFH